MCDLRPLQPPSTERCDAARDIRIEQPESDANPTEKCPILTPVSRTERRSTLGSIRSIDDDKEDIRLSCDDRTDSGIDVSFFETPLSRLCEKHGCVTLLQRSSNGSHHRGKIHSLSNELVEDWVSALLLPFEKLNFSWPVAQCQRPQTATASSNRLPGNPIRHLPWQPQDHITVNIGNSHTPGGSSGPHQTPSGRDNHVPLDDNSGRENEPDGDPKPSASNEDVVGGFPCVFHNIGSDGRNDPTPKCKWRRLYTSRLRGHHFHSSHPNGPFGCCLRCFETGRWVATHGGLEEWRRFTNKAEVIEHEKKCIRDICIDETCHNFEQGLPAFSPCSHGAKHTQQQIWKMWYRRAHSLTRNERVPNLTNPSAQQLRPPPAVLERSQSSPGCTRSQAVPIRTPAPRPNATVSPLTADSSSSHRPTASSSTSSALLAAKSTLEALTQLAKGLLQRVQMDPCEPAVVLLQACVRSLDSAERVRRDLAAVSPDHPYVMDLELLRSLVQECLRLLTTPVQRTPATWLDLSLSTRLTLEIIMPTQPPAGWCHQQQNFPGSSTSSSFGGTGMMFHSQIDPGTQQQQQFLPHQYQQQPQAVSMADMMGNSALNVPRPDITFSNPASVAQMGGAFTSQAADFSSIGVDDHIAQHIMNVPDQPYYPYQRLHAMNQPSTSMHGLAQQGQPPSMAPNNFPVSTENAYLPSRQGLLPTILMPPESDGDSGVFSTTPSNDHGMGGMGNDKGKGRANEAPEGLMDYSYRYT